MTKGKHLKGEIRILLHSMSLLLVIIKQMRWKVWRSTTTFHAFICDTAQKKVLVIYEFCKVVVELLLHNLEINFRFPRKSNERNVKNINNCCGNRAKEEEKK